MKDNKLQPRIGQSGHAKLRTARVTNNGSTVFWHSQSTGTD
jgi:hypothetical protein